MNLSKKLFLLISVFVLIAGVSITLLIKGKPVAGNANPLGSIKQEKWGQIRVGSSLQTTTFVQKNGRWSIFSPIGDWADSESLGRLLTSLGEFTIGSVISESESRYGNFDLEEKQAKRVQVYLKGEETPVLDGYFGKPAQGYGTSYFRFEGKIPVHLANGLPGYLLSRTVENYREKRCLPLPFDQVENIRVQGPSLDFHIARTSSTWSHVGGEELASSFVEEIKRKLKALRVVDFGPEKAENDQQFGLDKPFLTISVLGTEESAVLHVGKLAEDTGKADEQNRFARTTGRDTVLITGDGSLQILQEAIVQRGK